VRRLIVVILGYSEALLKVLAIGIHLWTVVIAYNWSDSVLITGLTFIMPVLAEIGWMVILWLKTKTFFTPFAVVIIGYVIILSAISLSLSLIESTEDGRFEVWKMKTKLKMSLWLRR
jgi:hypothetical protein